MQHTIERAELVESLGRYLTAHSPSGREDEVIALVRADLDRLGVGYQVDAARNTYVRIPGRTAGPATLVTAHLDEIGMIVKRVEANGRLVVDALGGSFPQKYGEGPVDILGDAATVPGVLSAGAVHVTTEGTGQFSLGAGQTHGAGWSSWWVETKLDPAGLRAASVRAGSKLVPSRSRKTPLFYGDYASGYGLDAKGAVPLLLWTITALQANPPAAPVIVAFTTGEEVGAAGAAYLASTVRPETMIAIEIGIVLPEFGLENSAAPIIATQDRFTVYDDRLVAGLGASAARLGLPCQYYMSSIGGSDASVAHSVGQVAHPGMIMFPTENSHGWEIAHLDGMANTALLLTDFLQHGL